VFVELRAAQSEMQSVMQRVQSIPQNSSREMSAILVYMTSLFGWMGAPFVFGVFTRAILRLIRSRIHESSLADMFCDDVIGFSGVQHAISDQAITVLIIEGTFGKGSACKRKKYGPSICGEAIGWYLDFFMETVRPNDKGIDSLTRCFLSLRHDTAISHKEYQVIASLACRYSLGLKGMRPFVHPLFRMITKSKRKPRVPSTEAWTAILMWQAIIIALIISPTNLSVSLYSFALFQ
jgi:DNA-binding ferritin-like protein (Dps family)